MDSVSAAVPGPQWERADYETGFANDEWAGIRWAYVWVTWSDIEVAPGVYDFTGLDALVVSAHRHGVHLMMQVQTAGDFVVPGPAQMLATGGYRTNSRHPVLPSSAPLNMNGPMEFWRTLARRYMPGGVLAASRRWNDRYGVTYFEVENEPDALPWITGTWSNVPRDYALYVATVKRTLSAVSRDLKIVGPALSTGPDGSGCCGGVSWLDQVLRADRDLEWASDTYRADAAAGRPLIGGGASIDVYSFHDDFYDPSSAYSVDRTRAVRAAIRRRTHVSDPALWETEGGPVTRPGDQVTYARMQAQVTVRLLAAGVRRLNFDASGLRGDSAQSRTTDPSALEARALTTYFPSYRGIAAEHLPGVEAYSWTNPATRLRSVILWAPSGAGESFSVAVPVRTRHAVVVSDDWKSRVVGVRGNAVRVQVQRGDPSPVVIVAETP